MAETLALASAIVSIVTVASQITSLSYSYISDIKSATKTQKAYLIEVTALKDVLVQAEKAFVDAEMNDSNEEQRPAFSKDMVEECLKELESLKVELETSLGHAKIMKKMKSRLIWPFEEKQTKKHIEMLHRYRDVFAQAMLKKIL